MNRRGVEFASALLMMAGTLGCVQQSERYLEYNTREPELQKLPTGRVLNQGQSILAVW